MKWTKILLWVSDLIWSYTFIFSSVFPLVCISNNKILTSFFCNTLYLIFLHTKQNSRILNHGTVDTVPATSVATKPNLCTKQPIFNELVWIIKVPPHSSPQNFNLALTGALKWGTVWTSISTGTRIVKDQIWTCVFY